MRLEGIHSGDIVEVDHRGRRFHALVTGTAPGGLAIQPTDRRVNHYSCRSREVIGHWAKRGTAAADERAAAPVPAPAGAGPRATGGGGAAGRGWGRRATVMPGARGMTASSVAVPARADRVSGMSGRVLILSWEYPPVIEGGLARHVRKLAEALVRQGVRVDVLTRGVGGEAELDPGCPEDRGGVSVHRVREPGWPRDLDRFVAWVEQMNRDMLAAGEALAREHSYDLVHGHDWLVGQAPPRSSPTSSACRT